MFRYFQRVLLDPRAESGGTETSTVPDTEARAPTVEQAEKLIDKHGSPAAAMMVVLTDAYNARERARQAEARIPGAGCVVLTKEQAAQWSEYQAIGPPDTCRKFKRDAEEFGGKLKQIEKEQGLDSIAEAAGIPEATRKVFRKVALPDAEHIVKEVAGDKEGEKVKRVFVKVKDGEAEKEIAFDDAYADFLPALRPAQGTQQSTQQGQAGPRGTPSRPNRGAVAVETERVAEATEVQPRRFRYF